MIMGPRLRKIMLTFHVVVSVGWIGAVAAYLVLDATATTSDDIPTLRGAYVSMDLITQWAIIPLAYATLVTGLIMSLGTKWGLFRHYWVIISLVVTLFAMLILLVEDGTIKSLAETAVDPATTDDRLRALPGTLFHSVGGTVVLLVVLVLNVYKPRGLTAYGWRKQQQERGVAQP